MSYLYILQFTCLFLSTRCIPKYWKTKSLANLSDLKKEEANSLNLRIYQALSAQFQDVLSLSSCQETGLNAIELGMVFRIIKTCAFSYFHYFYVFFYVFKTASLFIKSFSYNYNNKLVFNMMSVFHDAIL